MAFSAGFMYMCGPAHFGGRSGKPIAHDSHNCEERVNIPGMPPMTCRDLYPQNVGDKASKIHAAEATMTRYFAETPPTCLVADNIGLYDNPTGS
jgi:hypothetical protein